MWTLNGKERSILLFPIVNGDPWKMFEQNMAIQKQSPEGIALNLKPEILYKGAMASRWSPMHFLMSASTATVGMNKI